MRKTVIIAGSCLVAILILLSCGTGRQALRLPPEPEVTVEQGGITMSLRFLDEPSLRQRFGSSENPFLTDYDRIIFRRNVVFELTIRNQSSSTYRFDLHDCELHYAGKVLAPSNRFQIAGDVENRDEDRRLKARKISLANQYILPNKKEVPPGSLLSGFLLFQGNLPSTGDAQVVIPGESTGAVFQFQYVF
jgi:hypothetical protein